MANKYFSIRVKCCITGVVVFELVIPRQRYYEAVRDNRAEFIKNNWCMYNHADPQDYYGEITDECSAKAAREARHGLLPIE